MSWSSTMISAPSRVARSQRRTPQWIRYHLRLSSARNSMRRCVDSSHCFDLSMIWLPGETIPGQDPDDEENADKQMNSGFTLSDAGITEP